MTDERKRPKKRQTLARYGRRGDMVRVVVDRTQGAVLVYYRDVDGVPHKRTFTNTPEGRTEARVWAEAYLPARAAEAKRRAEPAPTPRLTHRQLWEAYEAAPAFAGLREKTQVNYREHWRTWERLRGRDTLVDETTLHHVDQLITELRAAGRATNQARQVVGVARIVMNWGQSRELVTVNKLALYKWKTPKGEEAFEPEEYSEAEFLSLLPELPPQDGTRWRPHVALMLAAHHGPRIATIRQLTADDAVRALASGQITWRAAIMKQGKDLVQPLTDEGRAALWTALYWRERLRYTGPWLLFAGGGNKKLAHAGVRRGAKRLPRRWDEDVPVTYQGLWRALTEAEKRAGVAHRERRAFHGFRKMVGGNIADATGDARLAMEWLGDVSPAMQRRYLKRRDTRLDRAAEHASTKRGSTKQGKTAKTGKPAAPTTGPKTTRGGAPDGASPHENVPEPSRGASRTPQAERNRL